MGKKYIHITNIWSIIINDNQFNTPQPKSHTTGDIDLKKLIMNKKVEEWINREENIDANTGKESKKIIGKCTKFTQSKIERLNEWISAAATYNPLALTKALKCLIFNNYKVEYYYISIFKTIHKILKL